MRATRARALRTDANPHPGRKHGGKHTGARGAVGGGMFWRFHKVGRIARKR